MHAMATSPTLDVAPPALASRPAIGTVAEVYARHADFVWASLARLGVLRDDLPDQLQEVFLVVHRRIDSFDGSSAVTTWLFGICLRVAQGWRRHRRRHPEDAVGELPEQRTELDSPEEDAARRQARRTLAAVLDRLEPDRRAVFVMFELEGMSCAAIAELLGVPTGTVYSRLHTARGECQRQLERVRRAGGGR
jgi:RNA polymerase sigma-70 factor (ECF subfamily)